MKQVTLYYSAARHVWTHDASGMHFIGWDEQPPRPDENRDPMPFERVEAAAKKGLAEYFTHLTGDTVAADDVRIDWKNAPNRNPPPPVEVQLTNFQSKRAKLAEDADPTAAGAYSAKDMKPPRRQSVA